MTLGYEAVTFDQTLLVTVKKKEKKKKKGKNQTMKNDDRGNGTLNGSCPSKSCSRLPTYVCHRVGHRKKKTFQVRFALEGQTRLHVAGVTLQVNLGHAGLSRTCQYRPAIHGPPNKRLPSNVTGS